MIQNQGWRFFIFIMKVAVGLTLLGFLLSKIDWTNLFESIRHMKMAGVTAAAIFFSGAIFAETLRLWVIFSSYSVSILHALRINTVGSIFAVFTPGQVGSDIYKVYAIRKRSNGTIKPVFLLLFVRICGAVALLLSLFLAVLLNWALIAELLVSGYLGLAPFFQGDYKEGVVIIPIVIMLAGFIAVAGFGLSKVKYFISTINSGFKQAQSEITWNVFYGLIFLSLVIMLFRVAMIYFLVISLGYQIGTGQLLLVVTLAMIGTMLPVSVGGLGVREGIIVVLLQIFHMAYEPAAVVALISRLFLIITAVIGIAWYYLSANADEKIVYAKE